MLIKLAGLCAARSSALQYRPLQAVGNPANDLRRDLFLPSLLRGLRAQAPGLLQRELSRGLTACEVLADCPEMPA
jgi:hypothetical protein